MWWNWLFGWEQKCFGFVNSQGAAKWKELTFHTQIAYDFVAKTLKKKNEKGNSLERPIGIYANIYTSIIL